MLEARKVSTEVLSSGNISVRDALRTQGDEAKRVIVKELKRMIDRKVFRLVNRSVLTEQEMRSTIRSSMFLETKYHQERLHCAEMHITFFCFRSAGICESYPHYGIEI
jgi:hypothetical protein